MTGNLLANNGSGAAFDPDGDPLHLVGTAALTAEGFQVELSSNGDFTAAIPASFVGQDSLNYTASVPNGDVATATATLDVTAPIGGTGDDTIYVNNSNDIVIEHSGHNSVIASVDFRMPANGVESLTFTGTASLTGQGNNLDNTMTANDAGDVLKDGNGNDTIIGGLGDDVLTGGSGTNLIYGGGGNDLITGGNGADTFLFKDATALSGEATIKDFHTGGAHSDVIDVSDVIDTVDPSGNNLHNFLELTHTGNNAFLAVNPDGSGWTNIVKIEHGSGLDLDTLIASGNLIV